MPRLTLKFLLKSTAVVMVFLLLLPLLLNYLDAQEQRRALEEAALRHNRQRRVKRDGLDHHTHKKLGDDHMVQQVPRPGEGDANHNLVAPAGQLKNEGSPEDPEHQFDHLTVEKHYGPKSFVVSGKRGNYEPDYKTKSGPGENGEPVYTSMSEKQTVDQSVREFGFNMVASDKISMTRTIPDTRMDECKYWQYPEKMPNASVIIVFHNEGWSTLMRTVHSVINMSPPHLLHEVVMVDDFSEKEHLKGRLEEYIKIPEFMGKVKLFRNAERLGLIMTRTMGAKYATGEVILFLDAHCECNRNWLPPLLSRIAYDRTIMAVPIIDGIDWNTFRYSPVYQPGEHFRGIFEWGFLYKESKVPQQERARHEFESSPYWAPTHAGGLFAMDRKYFFEMGAYDPGLQIWGGENFELSFKLWQCGGSIEWVPCSRVGHVYRNHMPYGFGKISPKIPVVLMNYMRVVEVWLDDEFKEYFYTREPTIRGYPIGNITDQLAFKREHKCKSFKWFMDNIAYEVYEKFPPPPPNKGWGEIKETKGYQCWDTMGRQAGDHGHIGTTGCHHFGGNQLYRFNAEGQIAVGERCIDVVGDGIGIIFCPVKPEGPWDWDEATKTIRHKSQDRCVQSDGGKLVLRKCNRAEDKQQWDINEIKTWSS